jgi:hypothetical protein
MSGLEIPIKLALCALAMLVLALDRGRGRRAAGPLLIGAAVLAGAAWFNFGVFHGRVFVHHWDQFHYQMGSKYFPELGYDGLYVASLGAQADLRSDGKVQEYARDLRSNRVERVTRLVPHMQEVWKRFTPERWQAFVEDVRFYTDANTWGYLSRIRLDHGYNATPTWTFMARLFANRGPVSEGYLAGLGLLDVALLTGLFAAIFATWGPRVGCQALLLLGLGYASRFSWIGGAFLRTDWIVAVGLALCLLERRRHFAAGTLFGYAAMVRLFPVLFLFGPAVLALRDLLRGERPRWAASLAAGVAAAVAAGLLAGSAAGRGPQAWSEFGEKIALHADTWLTNNVGLDLLLLYDRDVVLRSDVDWSLPEPWLHVQEKLDARREARALPIRLVQLAFLGLLAAGVWRRSPAEAALAGLAAVFALTSATCYYWIALLLLPLQRSTPLVQGVLGLNLVLYALHLLHPSFELRYGVFSLGLALLFLAWLGPEAWRNVRDGWRRSALARAPAPG